MLMQMVYIGIGKWDSIRALCAATKWIAHDILPQNQTID